MWDILKKYRVLVLVGFVLLAALIIYSLNLKNRERANGFERGVMTVTAPLMGVISGFNSRISTFWSDYLSLVGVNQENRKLREAVRELNVRFLESQEAIIANERLKSLLALKNSFRGLSVAASVIGEDSAPWFKTVVIDRGEVDGLQEGMPVLASSGIVGQLVKVSLNSSRVLLLTDHASSIAAMVQRSRARGVVKGKGGELCSMEFTVRQEDVKVGDQVMSSGIGRIFPKGVPLGEVTMVRKGEYGIFQTIDIRPAVNISHLEEVVVLLQKFE